MADLLKPGSRLGVMRPMKLKEPHPNMGGHMPSYGGMFHTSGAGRTDNIKTSVGHGSYIVPADVVSGLGSGNSLAGGRVLDNLTGGPHTGPMGLGSTPISGDTTPFAKGGMAFAKGGMIPIIVAGGEYHIPPKGVMFVAKKHGNGTMKSGHQILDHFVKRQRKKTIEDMKKLPGPKK